MDNSREIAIKRLQRIITSLDWVLCSAEDEINKICENLGIESGELTNFDDAIFELTNTAKYILNLVKDDTEQK